MDEKGFEKFYCDCLQSRGITAQAALTEANALYNGERRWRAVYKNLDANNDRKLTFHGKTPHGRILFAELTD